MQSVMLQLGWRETHNKTQRSIPRLLGSPSELASFPCQTVLTAAEENYYLNSQITTWIHKSCAWDISTFAKLHMTQQSSRLVTPTLSLHGRPSSFGLGSWHLQGKVVSLPVLMVPYREPVHLHHFLDMSNSRGHHHMGLRMLHTLRTLPSKHAKQKHVCRHWIIQQE